jgi:hypothetical protein
MKKESCVLAVILAASCAVHANASGHGDLSVGGIAIRVLVGGVLAVAVTIGQYWRPILSFCRRQSAGLWKRRA